MTIFKTPTEVLQDMLDDHKDITGVTLAVTDLGRDEVVKLFPVAGAISALRSENQQTFDDIFPGSSSEQGLEKHLAKFLLPTRFQPQESDGRITLTGDVGFVIPAGYTVSRDLDGKRFIVTETPTIPAGGSIPVNFQSVDKGQNQNIEDAAALFTAVSPIPQIVSAAVGASTFANGRNLETPGEMFERIEDHILKENTGGNLPAYEGFAREADPSVTSETAIKHVRGIGTVDLVITSGTTDIELAINNGDPVIRIPSAALIALVQAFVLVRNPTTDDLLTLAASELLFPIDFKYTLRSETVSQRALTDVALIKIIKIFVFSAKAGSLMEPTKLERLIDADIGHLISERRVSNFDGGNLCKQLASAELATIADANITLGTF